MGELAAVEDGSAILGGSYRILRCLYQRPRVNLYLAYRRTSSEASHAEESASLPRPETLVAIRELVLSGLEPDVYSLVVAAAGEEYLSPILLGTAHLPLALEQSSDEDGRHYLIMQLHNTLHEPFPNALPLSELLADPLWPSWLGKQMVLKWGKQFCRIITRLHRLGVLLGDLDPATIFVERSGNAAWSPLLLVSWPPPPQFWKLAASREPIYDLYDEVFPVAKPAAEKTFVAPELFSGLCDERSDVYSMGTLLYMLFTRYAPIAATLRLHALHQDEDAFAGLSSVIDGLELVAPHLLCSSIVASLEQVLLRALQMNPDQRYATLIELGEALEAAELEEVQRHTPGQRRSTQARMARWSRLFSTDAH